MNAASVPWLEQTWRWFGAKDRVTLPQIGQAGATSVVTALHETPNGAVWPVESIRQRKEEIERHGLRWSVVESVPIHEEIKQARGDCGKYLENYARSLRNLASCGVKIVCYNFMPLLDWTRTDTAWRLPNGAEALRFDAVDAALFDLHILRRPGAELDHSSGVQARAAALLSDEHAGRRQQVTRAILQGLPGTVDDFTVEDFRTALKQYDAIDAAQLRHNHHAFLEYVVPVAEECGVSLCIHPDDPPFPIFGLPRIAGTGSDLDAILSAVDSPANGITFCTGSLGAHPANDLPALFRRVGSRVHFIHLRNVAREADGSFYEADHLGGSTDMAAVMAEIVDELDRRAAGGNRAPLPMRPDHGHRMLGDLDQFFYPGYSAIGRLKGLAELRGLEIGLRHAQAHSHPRR